MSIQDAYDAMVRDKADAQQAAINTPQSNECRGRPKPAMKTLKILCWFNGGQLSWSTELFKVPSHYVRIPAEDKEIEVPE